MPIFDTERFGRISFEAESEIEFPAGLPGFERLRRFVALTLPETEPLIYLQSVEEQTCLLTAPAGAVDPEYRLSAAAEDFERIGLRPRRGPAASDGVLCLFVLSLREQGATANLLAPILINPRNRRGVQAISQEEYSHQHALAPLEAAVCS